MDVYVCWCVCSSQVQYKSGRCHDVLKTCELLSYHCALSNSIYLLPSGFRDGSASNNEVASWNSELGRNCDAVLRCVVLCCCKLA